MTSFQEDVIKELQKFSNVPDVVFEMTLDAELMKEHEQWAAAAETADLLMELFAEKGNFYEI